MIIKVLFCQAESIHQNHKIFLKDISHALPHGFAQTAFPRSVTACGPQRVHWKSSGQNNHRQISSGFTQPGWTSRFFQNSIRAWIMTGSAGTQSYLDHCGARVIEFEGRRERWWNGVRLAIVTVEAVEDWENRAVGTAFVRRFTPHSRDATGQHNRDHFKWNSLSLCWAVGIYHITLNLEQISRVMARCYHFTVRSHYVGLPSRYTSFWSSVKHFISCLSCHWPLHASAVSHLCLVIHQLHAGWRSACPSYRSASQSSGVPASSRKETFCQSRRWKKTTLGITPVRSSSGDLWSGGQLN